MRLKTLLFLVLSLLITAPAVAETPWVQADEEFILDGRLSKSEETDFWSADFTGAWAHFVTDNTEVGPVMSYSRDVVLGSSSGVGMIYEWNMPALRLGHFFLGGDAQYLYAGASELAPMQAATRFGYKLHIGESAALRVSIDLRKPIDPDSEQADDQLSELGLALGVSFGVKPATIVQ